MAASMREPTFWILTALASEPRRGARKVVTVVVCDVSGSTALGERLDPESLGRVMARYFERTRAVLERHHGLVQKFIGDAVFAVDQRLPVG